MNKRQFLKTSGAFMADGILSRIFPDERNMSRTNWAGNYHFHAEQLLIPQSVEEVQQFVKNSNRVKALGAAHSFNGIADTPGDQISLRNLKSIELDRQAQRVSVGAGITYGELAPFLYEHGFALHNLASLPHISVAGACATATHGSGNQNGNLSTAICAMDLVTASGKIRTLSRENDGEHFQGAVVHLGGFGVVTRVTLNLLPAFDVRQVVYENLSFDQLEHHLDEIFGSGYSVSLFTDWQNHRATQVWIKSRVPRGASKLPPIKPEFFGAKLATKNLHPIAGHSAENCTEQMGIPGPWYERLPHFRMNFTPSSGNELQSEYYVPREYAYQAIMAVEQLRDRITPHLFVTELRTVDGDDLWMSPCYKRPSLTIHFTWKPEWPAVSNLLPEIETQLAPYNARPHWAKLFTMNAQRLNALYPKALDFEQLMKQYDPEGKFRNEYLDQKLGVRS
jgi:xylitol oxidase